MRTLDRRVFLGASLAAGAGALVATRAAFAATLAPERFVLVILRGALDGLSAAPPIGDPDYSRLRQAIAIAPPGQASGALALDGTFGLHPSLRFLHERYQAGELAVLHALATPYRERSHFDGQDVLESGMTRPHAARDGWLNRALAALPGTRTGPAGVALGANVPLVMRGPAEVASWSPSRLPALDEDTLARIEDLYAGDPVLGQRLADALATDAIATEALDAGPPDSAPPRMSPDTTAVRRRNNGTAAFAATARAAAGFLTRPDGARVATLETTGWDTHANEGNAAGQLALRLGALDAGLREFSTALGPTWRETAILLVTEFGRTAAVNGTRGTDHGTGAAAFLVGGAVAGGRVLADWPGLGSSALHEGRDLRPTLDLRSVLKGILRDHLGVAPGVLDATVFPDSAAARAMDGLVR